jgi:hypothetical protein
VPLGKGYYSTNTSCICIYVGFAVTETLVEIYKHISNDRQWSKFCGWEGSIQNLNKATCSNCGISYAFEGWVRGGFSENHSLGQRRKFPKNAKFLKNMLCRKVVHAMPDH